MLKDFPKLLESTCICYFHRLRNSAFALLTNHCWVLWFYNICRVLNSHSLTLSHHWRKPIYVWNMLNDCYVFVSCWFTLGDQLSSFFVNLHTFVKCLSNFDTAYLIGGDFCRYCYCQQLLWCPALALRLNDFSELTASSSFMSMC